ncbi:uncharacterized protein K441DRAFT_358729 [Cenococcum geophilum 1.58]|uniref:Uncharacterized protein n=1 Tax=Cenococcum geophilum 1.58 TaxID=794803 RepID=A0ACC8ELU5_9PEZI|nr:hypothetical protein K441DRAFT_358729 [Cenococcum geophilum 1.58]
MKSTFVATAAAMSMLYLKSAIAGTVSCRALNLEGFGYSVFTIDGEHCRTVQGTPCWIGFNHRITLRGGGNCEGTVYWMDENHHMNTKAANGWRQWCWPENWGECFEGGNAGGKEYECECTTNDQCTADNCGYWDTPEQGLLTQ